MSHSAGSSAVGLLLSASASGIALPQPFLLSLPRIHSQKTRQVSLGPDTPKGESTQRLQSQGPMVSLLLRNSEERSFHSSPKRNLGKYHVTVFTGRLPCLAIMVSSAVLCTRDTQAFFKSKESSRPICSPQQASLMQESRPWTERSLYTLLRCPAHTLPAEQKLWAFVTD